MIKVTVLYPSDKGSKFDIDYYCNSHMPMVHFYLESADAFRSAFSPHAKEIMADIPNYTDIAPIIQISDVKV